MQNYDFFIEKIENTHRHDMDARNTQLSVKQGVAYFWF